MNILICIDDTDNLTSKGTGSIADELRNLIQDEFGGTCGFITRHQLLIHDDIPYTSHNSSMCFECEIDDEKYNELEERCFDYLKKESAQGSDPGLAIANLNTCDKEQLISYGKEAKRKILTKSIAYSTAKNTNVFLNEAGGTGQGVVGALAGIGLRLWGNDGTLRGKLKQYKQDEYYTVDEFKKCGLIYCVKDTKGNILYDNEKILVDWKAKPTMVNGVLTLLVEKKDNEYIVMSKKFIHCLGGDKIFKEGCNDFEPDVEEEQVNDADNSCYNCKYRRWVTNGIMCLKK